MSKRTVAKKATAKKTKAKKTKATTAAKKSKASGAKSAAQSPSKPAAKSASKTKAAAKKPAKKPAAKSKATAAAKSKAKAKTGAGKAPAAKAAAKKTAAKAAPPPPPPPKPKPKPKRRAKPVVLPSGYQPSEDEEFMNDFQQQYFREKLLTWKEEIIRQTKETLTGLTEETVQHADIADRATSETDRALELRARDRQRKLIAKIDAALSRLDDGSYGFCEDTGEPIGIKRLEARPIATLSLEAQERHERRERVYREE